MALRAIVASFAVHAGVAVGLVAAGRGGHAVPGAQSTMTAEILEIDTSSEVVAAPVPQQEEKSAQANVVAPPPSHTHPYPVSGHDARPHDSSEPHDHDHDHAPAGESAQAAAVVAREVAPAMPVFAMASGTGSMTAGTVRSADSNANGNGNGITNANAGAGANGDGPGVTYAVSSVSAAAKLVSAVTPTYPSDARADDVEGDVGLEIVVDAEGRVVDARVVKKGGHGFDEAALVAIKRYRFSAAQREGRNVRVRMPWTVQFRLR